MEAFLGEVPLAALAWWGQSCSNLTVILGAEGPPFTLAHTVGCARVFTQSCHLSGPQLCERAPVRPGL